jgi:RimJ/RimL family protein N-acetyltransferase
MSEITVPTLRSDRLILRGFRESDLDEYAAMMGNPAITRFLGTGLPRSRGETWEAMARAMGQWGLRGYGMFMLEHEGRLAGHCGILHPLHWPQAELAYALAPDFHGRGLITEAAQAVLAWAAARDLGPLVSYIRAENAPSLAVAARLGAVREADRELMALPAQVWRHGPPSASVPERIGQMVAALPELTTERLVIRGFRLADYEALCVLHADPEVMRYLGDGKPRDRVLTGQQMGAWHGCFALRGCGYMAITDRETGALLGRAGINRMEGWPEPELAYTLARSAWGRGIAAEAAWALRDWGWAKLDLPGLVSFIKVGNTASAGVAAKLGAVMTETIIFEGKPTERWEYKRP